MRTKNIMLIKKSTAVSLMLAVLIMGCTEKKAEFVPVDNDNSNDTAPVIQFSQNALLTGQVVNVNLPQIRGDGPFLIEFDFGDGSALSTATTYTYPVNQEDKQYEIFAIVTDVNNKSTQVSLGLITVLKVVFNPNNTPPITQITKPLNIVGLSVVADGLTSFDNESTNLSYQWDFGDHTSVESTKLMSHNYKNSGSYILVLTVSDGQDSSSEIMLVTVESNAASAFELSNAAINLLKQNNCSNCHYVSNAGVAAKTDLFFGQTADYTAASIKAGISGYLGSDQTRLDKAKTHPIAPSEHSGIEFSQQDDQQQWQALLSSIWFESNPAPANHNPTAQIDLIEQQDLNVMLSAQNSSDLDGDNLIYMWDLNGEKTLIGQLASYDFVQSGTKHIILTVTDGNGGMTQTDLMLVVNAANATPIADFNVDSNLLLVQFDASVSSDMDGDILSYAWDFGDNQHSILEKPQHQYAQAGNYTVTLTVSDLIDNQSMTRHIVLDTTVNHTPVPMINLLSNLNDTVSLSGESSTDDGQIVTYRWNFNGEFIQETSEAMYRFTTTGDKYISLMVIDEKGSSDSTFITLNIEDKTPNAMITVLAKNFLKVDFSSMGSLDPEGKPLSFVWDFGDDSNNSNNNEEPNPTHTYTTAGTYQVVLQVTDAAGNQANKNITLTIKAPDIVNAKPNAVITKTDIGNFKYEFSAADSSDPEGVDLTYAWDFANGETATTESVTITFASDAIYTVQLTVNDGALSDMDNTIINTQPVLEGDPIVGERLYLEMCSSCHDSEDSSKPNGGKGQQEMTVGSFSPIKINQYLFDFADPDLYTRIDATMPSSDPDTCTRQCAADIEAFMMTWQEVVVSQTCEKLDDEMKFGPRQMRLLTVREYTNTINDLFGFNVDISTLVGNTQIEGFSNQVDSSIDVARIDGFRAAADDVIEYSVTQNFDNIRGVNACGSDCVDVFINVVAKQLFRRPLTTDEVTSYRAMFDSPVTELDTAGNVEGMKTALKAAMTSVNFLYKSEVGQTKAPLQAFYDDLPITYRTVGSVHSESPPNLGSNSYSGGNATGEYGHSANWGMLYNFTGTDLIRIRVQTDNPKLEIYIASKHSAHNSVEELVSIDTGDDSPAVKKFKTFSFLVKDYVGDYGLVVATPYDNGGNRSIFIESIEISQGEPIPKPTVPQIPDGAFGLSTYEVATFLAYTYTGSTPDEELIAAADAGLVGDDVIRTQIERLLAKPEAKQHFGYFIEEWVNVEPILNDNKDALLFPDFTDSIRAAMVQELRLNFLAVLFDDNVPFADLYQAGNTHVNEELAVFYGMTGITGTDFVKAATPDRGGILLTGAFLAGHSNAQHSSIIIRGNQFRERLLCQHLPPIPSGADFEALREKKKQFVEEAKAQDNGLIRNAHLEYINTDDPKCGSCHYRIINPLGVGLEDYDTVGVKRSTYENGLSVDFTGQDAENREYHKSALYGYESIYTGNLSEKIDFEGGVALADIMSTLPKAQHCALEKSFRFMLGTGPDEYNHYDLQTNVLTDEEKSDNTCVMDDMASAMSGAGMNLKEAFIIFGLSDIVRFRKQGNR